MLHYTARNGTTFCFAPDLSDEVQVTTADQDGPPLPLDVQDLREFLQYVETLPEMFSEFVPDADASASGPD
jgi:hypothetical protein